MQVYFQNLDLQQNLQKVSAPWEPVSSVSSDHNHEKIVRPT